MRDFLRNMDIYNDHEPNGFKTKCGFWEIKSCTTQDLIFIAYFSVYIFKIWYSFFRGKKFISSTAYAYPV